MANIASSKKDARRSAVRAARNRGIKSSVKTKVAKFRRAVVEGGEDVAELAQRAISSLDRAASKGVLHRNNAARRKSRLAKRLASAAVEQPAAAPAKGSSRGTTKSAARGTAKPARSATKPAARKKS